MERINDINHRHFANLEAQFHATEKQAEELGESEKVAAINAIRSAIVSKGLSIAGIEHKKDAQASEGNGKTAIASYESGSDKISSIGADGLLNGAKSAGLAADAYTAAVFNHELTHRKSRKAEGAVKTDEILTALFGSEAVHNTEEAAASQAEGATQTAQFDAYHAERASVRAYAEQLNISNSELLKIRVTGDHRLLMKQALESGLAT